MFLVRRIAVLSLSILLLVVWLEKAMGPSVEPAGAWSGAVLWGARAVATLAIGWAIFTMRAGSTSPARALTGGTPRPTSFSPDDEGI